MINNKLQEEIVNRNDKKHEICSEKENDDDN